MTPQEYQRYLDSEEWKAKRLIVLDFYGRRCQTCGGRGNTVHHNTYERVGYERLHDLVLLCEECHKKLHGIRKSKGLFRVTVKGKVIE